MRTTGRWKSPSDLFKGGVCNPDSFPTLYLPSPWRLSGLLLGIFRSACEDWLNRSLGFNKLPRARYRSSEGSVKLKRGLV